jgi:biotin-[acetyl-CoA-carboxylase] ligase BirA-like protein
LFNISEIKSLLKKTTFVEEVIYFDSITSTNEYCKKSVDRDNALVITGFQSKGKGRFDRTWESKPGENLLFSLKKKIPRNSGNFFSVNYYFTYYLLDSIIKHLESQRLNFNKEFFGIKWPNDLLYKNKKFSGLLIESVVNKNEFIIGIGVNVNQIRFTSRIENIATSLKEITKHEINLGQLLTDIISGFSENFKLLSEEKDFEIYNLWKSQFKSIGSMVKYTNNEGLEEIAQVIDINEDGSIKLLKNGKISSFFSGEIKLLTN